MPYIDFNKGKKVKIWAGVSGALAHSERLTFGYMTLDEGIHLPEHQHPHEQWTNVISGELLFNLAGEEQLLTAGMAAFIPSNTLHSAKAITECKVLDCFRPVREDWVDLARQQA